MQFVLNSFHCMSNNIFIKKISTCSLCLMFLTTFLLTPFAFLICSLSTTIKAYIFNPAKSPIIFPLTSSFILPINLLLTGSKNLNLLDNH